MVRLEKRQDIKLTWKVRLEFEIGLHLKNEDILKQIITYFGNVGTILKKANTCRFKVTSLDQIWAKIIPHFDKYPLITQKKADYLLFKKVAIMIQQGDHLTQKGLNNIVNIRASMNLGLPSWLKNAFPLCVAVQRPLVVNQKISDPFWLAGFTTGEGCFFVDTYTHKNKLRVKLKLKIPQHSRDEELINSLVTFFNCGHVYTKKRKTFFQVQKFSDITLKIITFFKQYKIIGVKSYNFIDWCNIAEIMKSKQHLTVLGANVIYKIKQGINSKRP